MARKDKKKEKLTADLALFPELQGSIPHAQLDGVSEAKVPMKTVNKDEPSNKRKNK